MNKLDKTMIYVVFHFNAATPIAKRYKRLSSAAKKAKQLGLGWFYGTEKEFLNLPYATVLKSE